MANKPDAKQFTQQGSPISPLILTTITTTTTSSSSSSTSSGKPPQRDHLSSASSQMSNLFPTGNICPSGKIGKTSLMNKNAAKKDVLGSGKGDYGHGSIVRGGGSMAIVKLEETTKAGNESYKKGNFGEALRCYDRAVEICPANAACRNNRAAALSGMGRVEEAVKECVEAIRIDPVYGKAHHRLFGLYLR